MIKVRWNENGEETKTLGKRGCGRGIRCGGMRMILASPISGDMNWGTGEEKMSRQ